MILSQAIKSHISMASVDLESFIALVLVAKKVESEHLLVIFSSETPPFIREFL